MSSTLEIAEFSVKYGIDIGQDTRHRLVCEQISETPAPFAATLDLDTRCISLEQRGGKLTIYVPMENVRSFRVKAPPPEAQAEAEPRDTTYHKNRRPHVGPAASPVASVKMIGESE